MLRVTQELRDRRLVRLGCGIVASSFGFQSSITIVLMSIFSIYRSFVSMPLSHSVLTPSLTGPFNSTSQVIHVHLAFCLILKGLLCPFFTHHTENSQKVSSILCTKVVMSTREEPLIEQVYWDSHTRACFIHNASTLLKISSDRFSYEILSAHDSSYLHCVRVSLPLGESQDERLRISNTQRKSRRSKQI